MDLEKVLVHPQCIFCSKSKIENELIDMNTSSILLDEDMLEFNDLIRNLFPNKKIQQEQISLTCEDCKNLLIQFHVFKNQVAKSSLLIDDLNSNLKKVTIFLDENENEEVTCVRYNKCLTLVPESKRTFMEIFKHWQPHVLLEKLEELPAPRKRMKMTKSEPAESFNVNEESLEIEVIACETKSESIVEAFELAEESQQDGMTENEWLEMEIGNSEIVETEDGEVESWLCTHCDPYERFLDSTDFRNHLTSMHLDFEQVIYEEDEVVEEFESNSQSELIISHEDDQIISQAPVERELVVPDYYHCSNCSFTTENRDQFKMHQKTHVDQRQFQTTRFERLFCVDCCYQFTTQAHYQAHVNGHQLYEIVAKNAFYPICEQCNMMFCEESFANFHQEKHELGALIEDPIPAEGVFLKFGHHRPETEIENDSLGHDALKCGHCLKKFPDEESCRLHQLIFHITILKCPIESRVFNGNQAFSIHLKNNHPELFGDVKFLCSVCKMQFDTLYEKLRHMKNCDKKKFQCNHCDKKFSQKCYLMTHLRQISGQASVVCEVCQKVCRDKGDYQIHFRSHSNVKPFKCSICPKAYKTSSARAAHLETHMEKGFDCDFCTTKFKSRRTLQKHVKTKHQKAAPKKLYISNQYSQLEMNLVQTL